MAESPRPTPNTPPPAGRPVSPRTTAGAGRTPATSASAARGRTSWRTRINNNAVLVFGTGAVIILVLALVGYGYWDSYIRPARATAVQVGDRTYTMTDFVRRMNLALSDPQSASLPAAQLATLPAKLADDMVNEETALQGAATLGLAVSNDDIDEFMAEKLGAPFTRDESGRITWSRTIDNALRARLTSSGVTLAEYRRSLHGQRLEQEARKYFESSLPEALPAVHLRQIVVPDEAKAKEVKQKLDAGENFATLAASTSTDTATKDQGGLREWAPQGLLPTELDGPAFALPDGGVSDPIKSGSTYSIIKVDERTDSRQIADRDRAALVDRRFNDWLNDQKKGLNARAYLDNKERSDYALRESNALQIAQERQRNNATAPGRSPAVPPVRSIPSNPPPSGGAAPPAVPPANAPAPGTSGGGNP